MFSVGIVFGEYTALNNEPETLGKKNHKKNYCQKNHKIAPSCDSYSNAIHYVHWIILNYKIFYVVYSIDCILCIVFYELYSIQCIIDYSLCISLCTVIYA